MPQERPVCPVCGSNPCYGICPNNDPFGGDQAAEDASYHFNAQCDHRLSMYSPAEEPGYRDGDTWSREELEAWHAAQPVAAAAEPAEDVNDPNYIPF